MHCTHICIALYVAIYMLAKCTQISFVGAFHRFKRTICVHHISTFTLLCICGGEVLQRAHGASENIVSIVSCPTYIAKEKNGEGGGGVGESD